MLQPDGSMKMPEIEDNAIIYFDEGWKTLPVRAVAIDGNVDTFLTLAEMIHRLRRKEFLNLLSRRSNDPDGASVPLARVDSNVDVVVGPHPTEAGRHQASV